MKDTEHAPGIHPELEHHINETPFVNTHEHQAPEQQWLEDGPKDVLHDLFINYIKSDLIGAGCDPKAWARALDGNDPDIAGRWNGIKDVWETVQFTGYGEAVRILAKRVYGIDEITPASLEAAQPKLDALRKPGGRRRLVIEMANVDHAQIDDFQWACLPDPAGPDVFLYDISWEDFSSGIVKAEDIYQETGIEVNDLRTLRQAMEAIFDKYAACAIAVKSQHAYNRTLLWRPRTDADAERILQKRLKGEPVSPEEALVLGDWGLARGAELCARHNLPFKHHTGYHGSSNIMVPEWIPSGNMWELIKTYRDTRFVLMHIAYPYQAEAVAMAKHYTNVYLDMCWAWALNPYASMDFVRQYIHAAPIHKLFAFGGDVFWPSGSVAYAIQARRWLTRALSAEVREGDLTLAEAKGIATRIMNRNQYECFDVEGTRRAIAGKVGQG